MKNKKNNGITLIALVITIIVLLILAGVTIATLTGENGILTRASDAAERTGEGNAREKVQLAVAGSIGTDGNIHTDDLNTELSRVDGLTSGTPISSLPATVVVDEYEILIGANGSVGEIIRMEDYQTAETKPYLPSSSFTQVEGTNLDNGLVVTDGTNYWTWIEVSTSIYSNEEYNEGTAPTGANDYDAIERILNNYTGTLVNRNGYTDVWYDGNGNTAEDEGADLTDTSGCGLTYEGYNNLKNYMLSSVYTNGGFWIGQYEAGSSVVRTSESQELTTPVIKQDAYPYNYINCSNAQIQASQINSGNYTSSLLFGIQWDLVLKHFQTKGAATADELTSNSTEWGNYYNATFNIARGAYSTNYGASFTPVSETYPKSGSVLLTTGASTDRNVKMNIYDLAGNVWEWTIEKSTITNGPCAYRGGYFSNSGSSLPASYRYDLTTSYSSNNGGFRPALY